MSGQHFGCEIPATVRPGDVFEVRIPGDHRIQVRCPPGMKGGDRFHIKPFPVVVPPTAKPNQQFSAVVNSINTTIRCPKKTKPGETIIVYAPIFPSSAKQSETCKTWDKTKWEAYLKHMQQTTPGLDSDLASKADTINPDEIPSDYVCPITEEIMSDPVLTVDGHTYERKAIEAWFETHETSPKTNTELPSKIVIPNRALRSRIVDFLESYTPKPLNPQVPTLSHHLDELDFTTGAFSQSLRLDPHDDDDNHTINHTNSSDKKKSQLLVSCDSDSDREGDVFTAPIANSNRNSNSISNNNNSNNSSNDKIYNATTTSHSSYDDDGGDDFGVLEVCGVYMGEVGKQEVLHSTMTDQGMQELRHVGFVLKQGVTYRLGFRFRVIGGTLKNLRCILRTKRADGKGHVEVSEKVMGTFRGSDNLCDWSFPWTAPSGPQAPGKYESALQFVDGSETMHFQGIQSHVIN